MATLIQKAKKTKKQRKFGRNSATCAAYAASHRRERNKLLRLKKHLVRFPGDAVATVAADRCRIAVGGR